VVVATAAPPPRLPVVSFTVIVEPAGALDGALKAAT
jgi:hypothetical protein